MILKPWQAATWRKGKKRVKAKRSKLICPFCLKSHRTRESAHVCALEVSKYGSVEMKQKFQYYEEQWLVWYKSITQ